MKSQWPCQRCGETCTDTTIRVPGPHKMGRVLMEQYVCKCCQDSHIEGMRTTFKHVKTSDPTQCNTCAGNPDEPDKSLGPKGPFYAHYKPLVTGDWKTIPVCEDCFNDYHQACKDCHNTAKGG